MPQLAGFLLLGLLVVLGGAQHCQRGLVVHDTQSQCLLSANFNLENACYVCPVLNLTGYYQLCLSLYDDGYATCTQPLALQARQSRCRLLGGDPNAAEFQCLVSAGTNKSQSSGWTGPATGTPTTAPPLMPSHAASLAVVAVTYGALTLLYVALFRG